MATPSDSATASRRPLWRLYLELTKPKVVALITFTAIVGTLLASPGVPPLEPLIIGNLGIALAAACAATINHLLDARIDAQMARTRARPLPAGQLSERAAVTFAAVLGLTAMTLLAFLVNLLIWSTHAGSNCPRLMRTPATTVIKGQSAVRKPSLSAR